ncbi:MAG: sodium:proton antiporter [Ignisphaera sp.]
MRIAKIVDPFTAIYLITVFTIAILAVTIAVYYTLKSKRVRITSVYLGGEPENVVSMITPSVGALYWGFMKRFAKHLYEALVEKIHTGSLHDWQKFISSWLAILIIISIISFVLFTLFAR